jgi:antitoxin YefM
MSILPLNDVKTRFSAIADEVAATHDRVIVTRNGRPQDILAADQEISAGDYHTLDEMRAVLEERQRQEDAGA